MLRLRRGAYRSRRIANSRGPQNGFWTRDRKRRLINYIKTPAPVGKCRHQIPGRQARNASLDPSRPSLFVEHLPCERPAFFPTCAFRPGEEDVTTGISNYIRMFTTTSLPWRGNGL